MTTSDITYRGGTSQDMPSIIHLIKSVRGNVRMLDYRQFIVVCHNNEIIGCVRTFQPENDYKELASLVVLPEYRGKGIGAMLVRKILERDDSRPLYLICFRNKIDFYRKHNFHKVDIQSIPETLQKDFKRMTEKGLDLVIMELK